MPLGHLLVAVRNQIRDQLPDDFGRDDVTVQPDEKPPVEMGKQHIVVYCQSWTPTEESDTTKDEQFQVNCSLTMRVSAQPSDRIGQELYIELLNGIAKLSDDLTLAVNRNYNIINNANTSVGLTKFFEPLIWQGTDGAPRIVDGSWFFADPTKFAGLVMESRFLGARAITDSNLLNS